MSESNEIISASELLPAGISDNDIRIEDFRKLVAKSGVADVIMDAAVSGVLAGEQMNTSQHVKLLSKVLDKMVPDAKDMVTIDGANGAAQYIQGLMGNG